MGTYEENSWITFHLRPGQTEWGVSRYFFFFPEMCLGSSWIGEFRRELSWYLQGFYTQISTLVAWIWMERLRESLEKQKCGRHWGHENDFKKVAQVLHRPEDSSSFWSLSTMLRAGTGVERGAHYCSMPEQLLTAWYSAREASGLQQSAPHGDAWGG